METVRLRVVGITYTQIENGMYALVLQEEGGHLRIPIIIGYTEAQAIESAMQRRETSRPLPHDTIGTILRAFDINMEYVMIRLNDNGIFTADIRLTGYSQSHIIDARSSDAIAMALRLDAPIMTSRDLLEKCGVDKDELDVKVNPGKRPYPTQKKESEPAQKNSVENPLKNISVSTLHRMMDRAVVQENYEKAARIKDELDRRNDVGSDS